jgi:predicted transcriptional regulator
MQNDLTDSKSMFLEFFGASPQFRMIDFLLENRLSDFTKTEIAKSAGISWASLFNHWEALEKNQIVQKTRTVGRATLYRLNEKSPLVKQLKSMELILIQNSVPQPERMVARAGKVAVKQ